MISERNDDGTIASPGVVCVNGHLRTDDNIYVEPSTGKRKCRACRRARTQPKRTPTNESWRSMKGRCTRRTHQAWARYGGRGITYCDRWESFANFLADMGERPEGTSLDRIDPDGNYEPGNCRWATPMEQRHNRSARLVSAAG